jgi:hypothetical protein
MTDYPFDMQLVVDPLNPDNVVLNAAISIYDPADTAGTTLLPLKDLYGFDLPNPLNSNHLGFIQAFTAELPQVMWKAGTYSGFFESYTGLRDEAVAAATAAEASALDAEAAAASAEATANGFTVGTVTSGTPAAASFTGTAPNRVLHLTIPPGEQGIQGPAGEDGADGADGADGHNPITVSATEPASPADGDIWFDIS